MFLYGLLDKEIAYKNILSMIFINRYMENIHLYDHFADNQIRRFLIQIVRGFSGFQYQTGARGNTPAQLRVVPCMMARRNRQAEAIRRNLSENTINTVPLITIDHTGLAFDPTRLQNTNHVSKVKVSERKFDPQTGEYTSERGNSATVERIMGRPFIMSIQVSIWTSNQDQKHQLMEQILPIIYPSFDIQNSDNPVDWTALTTARPTDLTWSTLTVPIGSDNSIDAANISLEIPIWLSPPAKIKRTAIIEKIITNINNADLENGVDPSLGDTITSVIVTPENHHINVKNNKITLLGANTNSTDANGEVFKWDDLFDKYQRPLVPAQTLLSIKNSEFTENEIFGRLQKTEDENILEWQIDIDSLPSNTLSAVDGVIDPMKTFPTEGLPEAQEGQRYLLFNDLAGGSLAWGNGMSARKNMIVEYKEGEWKIVFDATSQSEQYVLNRETTKQLRWDGVQWTLSLEGIYAPKYWRIN